MRTLAFLIIILFFAFSPACASDWSRSDTYRQVTYSALHLLDWSQTRYIAENPSRYYESYNLVLGRHPSKDKVDIYYAATLAIHTAVARLLDGPYREGWQYITIGVEGPMVVHNFRIGIGFGF